MRWTVDNEFTMTANMQLGIHKYLLFFSFPNCGFHITYKNFLKVKYAPGPFLMLTAPGTCLLYALGAVYISNMVPDHLNLQYSSRFLMVQDHKVLLIMVRYLWSWTMNQGQNAKKKKAPCLTIIRCAAVDFIVYLMSQINLHEPSPPALSHQVQALLHLIMIWRNFTSCFLPFLTI